MAPAGGRVVAATDGVPDNSRPGVKDGPAGPGNHIVIDHGGDEFSFLAHFRVNSVAVRSGQIVKAGDVLGACGNSGKSDLPHVHYHLQNSPTYGKGLGLPAPFDGYFAAGRLVQSGEPRRGDLLQSAISAAPPGGALQTSP